MTDKLRRRYGPDALALAAADSTFDPDALGPPRLRVPADTTWATFPGDVPEPLAILVEGVRAANQAVPALIDYLAERSESGVDARLRQQRPPSKGSGSGGRRPSSKPAGRSTRPPPARRQRNGRQPTPSPSGSTQKGRSSEPKQRATRH